MEKSEQRNLSDQQAQIIVDSQESSEGTHYKTENSSNGSSTRSYSIEENKLHSMSIQFDLALLFSSVKNFIFEHLASKFLIVLEDKIKCRQIFLHSYILSYLFTQYSDRQGFISELIEMIAEKQNVEIVNQENENFKAKLFRKMQAEKEDQFQELISNYETTVYSYQYEEDRLLFIKKSGTAEIDDHDKKMNMILNDIFECQILLVEVTQLNANLDHDFHNEQNEFEEDEKSSENEQSYDESLETDQSEDEEGEEDDFDEKWREKCQQTQEEDNQLVEEGISKELIQQFIEIDEKHSSIFDKQKLKQYFELDEKGCIVDFYWQRDFLFQLGDFEIIDNYEFDLLIIRIVRYFAELHLQNFFHGDIKPENIFYDQKNLISSDCGSILYMKNSQLDDKNYVINIFTPGYCSIEHLNACRNSEPRSKRQLFKEDQHQLIVTFKVIKMKLIKKRPHFNLKILNQVIEMLSKDDQTIIQVYHNISPDRDIFLKIFLDLIRNDYNTSQFEDILYEMFHFFPGMLPDISLVTRNPLNFWIKVQKIQKSYVLKGGKIRKYDINNESDFFYMIKTLNLMCLSYIIKICKIMDCIDKDPLNDNINDLVDIMIQKNSKDYNFREALLIQEEEAQKINADLTEWNENIHKLISLQQQLLQIKDLTKNQFARYNLMKAPFLKFFRLFQQMAIQKRNYKVRATMVMFSQLEQKVINFEKLTPDQPTYIHEVSMIKKMIIGMPYCFGAFIEELDKFKSVKLIQSANKLIDHQMKDSNFLDFVRRYSDILDNSLETFIDQRMPQDTQNKQREVQQLLIMFIKLKCFFHYKKNKYYKFIESKGKNQHQTIRNIILNKFDREGTEARKLTRYVQQTHCQRYSHPRKFSDDKKSCRVCKNTHGIIRKYSLYICRRCFREHAENIGFHKYR